MIIKLEHARRLQAAVRLQTNTKRRLEAAGSDDEIMVAAGAYIAATDACFEAAIEIKRPARELADGERL